MLHAFVSHSSHDSEYVLELCASLRRHMGVFAYETHQRADMSFVQQINREMGRATAFLICFGDTQTEYFLEEVHSIQARKPKQPDLQIVCVVLTATGGESEDLGGLLNGYPRIVAYSDKGPRAPSATARDIVVSLAENGQHLTWCAADGLPSDPHLFSYEKNIIGFFERKLALGPRLYQPGDTAGEESSRALDRQAIANGCPTTWPRTIDLRVVCSNPVPYANRRGGQTMEDQIGRYRPDTAMVNTAALFDSAKGPQTSAFAVPEAGPRSTLRFPVQGAQGTLQVAIIVLGGIAPGINAVIDGIVQRHDLYSRFHQYAKQNLRIHGHQNGLHGLLNGVAPVELFPNRTSEFATQGGSMIGTSRISELIESPDRLQMLKEIVFGLRHTDILYMIGGDGTMKAAHALFNVARDGESLKRRPSRVPLSVVAIPKTMDNDILWVWQSFGFMSAVDKAREFIQHLHTEVNSNPRLCILQLFGSDSGFVVSHAVLASAGGHCDAALIPEVDFSLLGLAAHLSAAIDEKGKPLPAALLVMAETAIPLDAVYYAKPNQYPLPRLSSHQLEKDAAALIEGLDLTNEERDEVAAFHELHRQRRRVQGQTSDSLRRVGLKIVQQGLEILLKRRPQNGVKWPDLRVLTSEPRHLVRAIAPSTSDIIIGQRLGALAVDNAMAGYTDFMVSQWLTEYVLVPLELVALGRKRIPESGIFWKSVLAKTRQPADLVDPWPYEG